MAPDGVVVGIDAGGTATRARAVRRGEVVHEGAGGPGNPLMAGPGVVEASYQAALAGCPAADRVAACVFGAGGDAQRAQVAAVLAGRFPAAEVRVAPDYVAALLAAPPGSDVCVVAGTGSVVCSRADDGSFAASGGRGWILGDHGGAARLGRAALEHYVTDPGGVPGEFAAAVASVTGTGDWRSVVGALHAAPNPAPLLARAAPLLTAAADEGQAWAAEELEGQMTALAATAAGHIGRHLGGRTEVRVALSGGVWSSRAAWAALTRALGRLSLRPVTVTWSHGDPVDGAIRLAESLAR
ncbi:MAG: N-acetylglucosamine kinase [Streptosporangiaceae bacterium]